MNRLQVSNNPMEENLGLRLGSLINDVWKDPLVGENLPDPRFHASIRFLALSTMEKKASFCMIQISIRVSGCSRQFAVPEFVRWV